MSFIHKHKTSTTLVKIDALIPGSNDRACDLISAPSQAPKSRATIDATTSDAGITHSDQAARDDEVNQEKPIATTATTAHTPRIRARRALDIATPAFAAPDGSTPNQRFSMRACTTSRNGLAIRAYTIENVHSATSAASAKSTTKLPAFAIHITKSRATIHANTSEN